MDLNELLHRHQVSLMCADAASCPEARISHRGLANLYEGRIRTLRPTANRNSLTAATIARTDALSSQ